MTIRGLLLFLLIGLAVAVAGLFFWRSEGDAPVLGGPERLLLGEGSAEVRLQVEDQGSGLRRASATLRHAGGETELVNRLFPGKLLPGGAEKTAELVTRIDPAALALAEGEAFLDLRATDWSWRSWLSGNESLLTIPVTIDLTAPKVYIESGLTYVRRGGAAAVVYTLSEASARDGVTVGDAFFPGYPFPVEGEVPDSRIAAGKRFAIFAIPRNAPEKVKVRVIGQDEAGNESFASFPARIQERVFEDVRISLPGDFLERKVPELADKLKISISDGSIQAFKEINTAERQRNEERIDSIVAESELAPLWNGGFEQMRNSAVTSGFAEYRTYYWSGQQISEAIHYGYDLASTSQAPITASNRGRVLFADELGIYGNCVIVDHGLGLASLYAHLSKIDVEVGALVERGHELGRSGVTGLAGGDHLHFAILVNGHYVDPKEWWDPRWVADHIEVRMQPAP